MGQAGATLSGIGVVLQQLDHVAEAVPQLCGAAHLGQHAEEVCVGDALAADVGQQVGAVGRLAQDDLGVVRVEVDLNTRKEGKGELTTVFTKSLRS